MVSLEKMHPSNEIRTEQVIFMYLVISTHIYMWQQLMKRVHSGIYVRAGREEGEEGNAIIII